MDPTNNVHACNVLGFLKMSAIVFKRPVWRFSLLFIASVLSVANKTDNSCVVCNKCLKGK